MAAAVGSKRERPEEDPGLEEGGGRSGARFEVPPSMRRKAPRLSSLPITSRDTRFENCNIISEDQILTPDHVKAELSLTEAASATIIAGQKATHGIITGEDHRLLVVVGPCSIHDPKAAMEYAKKLKVLADEVSDTLLLVMRVYFEKPRTNVGWKGFINDPYLDDSCDIEMGLYQARKLMLGISELGVPVAGEALDMITPQYMQEFLTWTAIGARTTESQTHRNMASGFTSAVGFKNGTSGDVDVAVNAILTACQPHTFLSVDLAGRVCIVRTTGNRHCHVVLRGGSEGPNHSEEYIKTYESDLAKHKLPLNLMVDCSHGNSQKDPANQPKVLDSVVSQIEKGNKSIFGVMVESNLGWGRQALPSDLSQLQPGVSITDACIDWDTTVVALRDAAKRLKEPLRARVKERKVTE